MGIVPPPQIRSLPIPSSSARFVESTVSTLSRHRVLSYVFQHTAHCRYFLLAEPTFILILRDWNTIHRRQRIWCKHHVSPAGLPWACLAAALEKFPFRFAIIVLDSRSNEFAVPTIDHSGRGDGAACIRSYLAGNAEYIQVYSGPSIFPLPMYAAMLGVAPYWPHINPGFPKAKYLSNFVPLTCDSDREVAVSGVTLLKSSIVSKTYVRVTGRGSAVRLPPLQIHDVVRLLRRGNMGHEQSRETASVSNMPLAETRPLIFDVSLAITLVAPHTSSSRGLHAIGAAKVALDVAQAPA